MDHTAYTHIYNTRTIHNQFKMDVEIYLNLFRLNPAVTRLAQLIISNGLKWERVRNSQTEVNRVRKSEKGWKKLKKLKRAEKS